jgi:hypothetical protein
VKGQAEGHPYNRVLDLLQKLRRGRGQEAQETCRDVTSFDERQLATGQRISIHTHL